MGGEPLPVFTSAYCRPVDVVVKSRLGAALGAALAIVERVVMARSGE